jgi:hypothetical protein
MGYGVAAAAKNEFSGLTFTCTEEEALTGCIPDGDAFLRRQSLDGTNIGANIGYIILLAVGSRFVAYLALRCVHVMMDVAPLACATAFLRGFSQPRCPFCNADRFLYTGQSFRERLAQP